MANILVVEDDKELFQTMLHWLEGDKHSILHVVDGMEAWQYLSSKEFDLVILDWQLPSLSGIDLCKRLRERDKNTPVLMLTGKADVDDRVLGLESGADDYLTKPFSLRELIARVHALLRRTNDHLKRFEVGLISLDSDARRVLIDGQEIKLKPTEYGVLEYLMRNPNKVLSPERILQNVWGMDSDASVDSVYVCVNRLRKKLDKASEYIRTVHSIGYQFRVPD